MSTGGSAREDWKKRKELEEARKAGTAPAETDESGRYVCASFHSFVFTLLQGPATVAVASAVAPSQRLWIFFYFLAWKRLATRVTVMLKIFLALSILHCQWGFQFGNYFLAESHRNLSSNQFFLFNVSFWVTPSHIFVHVHCYLANRLESGHTKKSTFPQNSAADSAHCEMHHNEYIPATSHAFRAYRLAIWSKKIGAVVLFNIRAVCHELIIVSSDLWAIASFRLARAQF